MHEVKAKKAAVVKAVKQWVRLMDEKTRKEKGLLSRICG
jgi:hypothetical protein